MKNRILKIALLLSTATLASHASATVQYHVRSTSVVNCDSAPHGLWTNNDIGGGGCANYFNIYGLLEIDNMAADSSLWTATLTGVAANPAFDRDGDGDLDVDSAIMDLTLSGFTESSDPYKQEGGAAYDPASDVNDGVLPDAINQDIDFFTEIAGTITINSSIYNITNYVDAYAFQFGYGANAKSPTEFGGSAWIQSADIASHHWDLNLSFIPSSTNIIAVPAPAGVIILGLGLFGLGIVRGRNTRPSFL